jgi:hypothetical protein
MIINDDVLTESIKGKQYIDFLKLFPSSKSELDIVKNETNPKKISVSLERLRGEKNFKVKLRTIFGKDITFAEDLVGDAAPTKEKFNRVVDVFEVDSSVYKQWFKDFHKKNKNIIFYDSCYNSKEDKYVASVVFLEVNL